MTAPTSAAAPRSWAPCPAAAPHASASASAACSGPTPASASRLGDDCVVEAGLYVTAGTKVTLLDATAGSSRPRSCRGVAGLLFLPQLRDRRGRGALAHRAGRSSSTARCTPTPDTRADDADAPPDRPPAPPARVARGAARCSPSPCSSPSSSAAASGVKGVVTNFGCRRLPATALGTSETSPRSRPANAATISRRRRAPGAAAARRDDRHRDRDPGVQAAQHHLRRPRLPRPVPAAPAPGLGHARRRSPTRSTPATSSTTRWSRSRATRHADHQGRPEGAAQRLPRGVRRPRAARGGCSRRP